MDDTERQTKVFRHVTRADAAHHIPLEAFATQRETAAAEDFPGNHAEVAKQLIDAASNPIAVCDNRGVLLLCNTAWSSFDDGYHAFKKSFGVGENLLQAVTAEKAGSAPYAAQLVTGVAAIIRGDADSFTADYVFASGKRSRTFKVAGRTFRNGTTAKAIVTFEETPVSGMLPALEPAGQIAAAVESLSNRERQILDLILAGEPNKLIASQLDLSQKTVEKHRSSLMRKLGAQNVVHLVRKLLGQEGPLRTAGPQPR